jgi:hypothetical protein
MMKACVSIYGEERDGVLNVDGWEGVRKRDPNDKNYSVANPFGLQYASQAPVMLWFAPRTGIELVDPLHPTNR